jgi:hypothetical protein
MNNKIKELAEQAGYLPDMFGIGHWDMPEFQKFTKLIVKECLTLADKIRDGCDGDGESQQALGAAWVGITIAVHFGIEE